ncbi:MAG TPA: MgtC/SapB family protein [Bacilli bacterium]
MENVWQISMWDLTLRILAAAALGGVIGFEREWNNHAAGLRTHILVCIGSSAIMLLSIYGFNQFVNELNVRVDPARLAAQVVSGIGFLGAGAIMRNGSIVSGLTTAASIWVVAAIGLCVGAGFYYVAVLSTVMVLISLFVLNKLEKNLLRNKKQQDVVICYYDGEQSLGEISNLFGQHDIQVVNVNIKPEESAARADDARTVMKAKFSIKMKTLEQLPQSLEHIRRNSHVISIETQNWNFHNQDMAKRDIAQ